jgi:hypothetical protein
MNDDYGVDIDEVYKVIDAADVLVVRFHIIQKRLLVDFRSKGEVGPMLAVVERAESVEERFRSIKRMRPEFGFPEKVMSFAWPRSMPVFVASGTWQHIVDRVSSIGGEASERHAAETLEALFAEERREVAGAIRGADHYQTLWERQRA